MSNPLGMIGASLAGPLLGIGLAEHNDKRQLEQQQQLQNMQIEGQKHLTDYSYGKQMEMWEKTNYQAQIEQMKKAGVNPGLLYGMKGGGGVTTGTAGNTGVSGGNAPVGGGEIQGLMGIGLQTALTQAQIDNVKADTVKKNVEANKIGGVDTALGNKQIESLTQGISNQKAVEELTKIQTKIARMDEYINRMSAESEIDVMLWQSEKIMEEAGILHRQNIIDQQVMNEKVSMIKTELASMILSNEIAKEQKTLIQAQTKTEKGKPAVQTAEIQLMRQQVESLVRQGVQKWAEISIASQNANTNQAKTEQDNWVNDVQASTKLPMDVIEKIAQGVIFKNLISPAGHTPIQGFRR